jgi:hypothetical protein
MEKIDHRSGWSRFTLSHPGLLAVAVVLAPALWASLVWTSNPHEHIAGLLCEAVTLLFLLGLCHSTATNLTIRIRDLAQCWRVPWYILSKDWEITVLLVKDVLHLGRAQSLFRVCGFDSSTHDPVRVARTVMAVAFTTAAPNFIVIGIDPSQSRMLFHQIARGEVPEMTKALGAKG